MVFEFAHFLPVVSLFLLFCFLSCSAFSFANLCCSKRSTFPSVVVVASSSFLGLPLNLGGLYLGNLKTESPSFHFPSARALFNLSESLREDFEFIEWEKAKRLQLIKTKKPTPTLDFLGWGFNGGDFFV